MVQVEDPPMDVAVALEHGLFFRPTTGVVAPYFGPTDAKVGRVIGPTDFPGGWWWWHESHTAAIQKR